MDDFTSQIILPHSGYKSLIVYKKSDVIYQGTVLFCKRFLPAHGDRTVDQMTQAARSCKQNIAEGSASAAASLETQIKLTSVARASLDELLEDYSDYLKAHNYCEWNMNSIKKIAARKFAVTYPNWDDWHILFETRPADTICNLMIVLIQQSRYMLDKMLNWQEQDFITHGGIRERMYRARIQERAETWDKSIFSQLISATTLSELEKRAKIINEYVSQSVRSIKKQKGWC